MGSFSLEWSLTNLASTTMVVYHLYGLLLAYIGLPGLLLGDLAFRCPSCTAEYMATCSKVDPLCTEIVREPGCGCCPVCARQVGELCGVYLPRCSTGLRCYPSVDTEFPLQQLIQGFGRCGQRMELDIWISLNQQARNGEWESVHLLYTVYGQRCNYMYQTIISPQFATYHRARQTRAQCAGSVNLFTLISGTTEEEEKPQQASERKK